MTQRQAAEPKQDEVYRFLKSKVLDGEFSPGQRLSEEKIARMLSVSRMPVREAMSRLHQEGLLVDGGKYRSKYVRYLEDYAAEDIVHHHEVREVVEGLAARLAATNLTGRQVNELRDIETRFEESWTTADQETRRHIAAEFHRYIVANCGNPLLFEIWESHRLMPFTARLPQVEEAIWSHFPSDVNRMFELRPILDAIAAHDPDRAAAVTSDFVRRIAKTITSALQAAAAVRQARPGAAPERSS